MLYAVRAVECRAEAAGLRIGSEHPGGQVTVMEHRMERAGRSGPGEKAATGRRCPQPLLLAASLLAAIAAAPSRADEPEEHWEAGEPRLFLSARADVGIPEHLGLAAGWGKPHWLWGGAEAHGVLSLGFASASADLRLSLLVADLTVGLRRTHAFQHLPLPEAPWYDALPTGAGSSYSTLDLFGSGVVPTPGGLALWEVDAIRFLGSLPAARYEEWLRAVCAARWCAVAKLAWTAKLRGGALYLGAGAEWAFADGRPGPELVRVGPILSWRLWPHLSLQGVLYLPVSDPDRFGFLDRVDGALVLSWTFATGDSGPAFP